MKSKLYNGDCLELLRELKDESVDTIVSSPPYNIGKEYENRKHLDSYLKSQSEVLKECYRVLKPTGSIFWQVGSYSLNGSLIPLDVKFFPIFENLGMISRNRIIWLRPHGLHASKKFSGRHETILWFSKSNDYKFNLDNIRVPQKYQNKKHHSGEKHGELSCNPDGKNPGDIWAFRNVKHNHEEQTIHPCQFPEDLIARVILCSTDKGDVVLDPYMGTGTVAVVANENSRKYVCSEIDSSYFEVASRRLSGLPNDSGSFANLKCLRRYVKANNLDIAQFKFDVQVSKTATSSEKSKIYPEEHHLNEFVQRISFEEDCFSSKINNLPIPEDPLEHNRRVKKKDSVQLSVI